MKTAIKAGGGLPENVLRQYPTGRWGFCGSVAAELAFVTKDGGTPTESQLDAARHCGPGIAGLRPRTWDSKAAALAAVAEIGAKATL